MSGREPIVPLVRRFSPTLSPSDDESTDSEAVHPYLFGKNSSGWEVIEEKRRCVIIADAGAGKTHEMLARARYSAERGRYAFFIRIENIREAFASAFDVGDAESFEKWIGSEDDAWFFLDSVDEALLQDPLAFEEAMRAFAARIADARERAYIIISSRSYAWRARTDRQLLDQLLPYESPKANEIGEEEIEEAVQTGMSDPNKLTNSIDVVILDDLDEDDIRMFAAHLGASDIEEMMQEIKKAGLSSLSSRPYDLLGILTKWRSDRQLGGRLGYLKHSIAVQLDGINWTACSIDPSILPEAVGRIAASVILTGKAEIRVPGSANDERGFDPIEVLPDWPRENVVALLDCTLFTDAVYGVVRFRHRDIRELLAAEWFADQLANPERRAEIEAMLIREKYGERILTPRFRPMLPWLVLLDDRIRREVTAIRPEIAVEGGDVASLPVEERRSLFHSIVEQIAEGKDDRGARDNDAIARIAHADLSSDVAALVERHAENDDALFFLGRLVWQGQMTDCLPLLLDIARSRSRGLYARIAATRAVFTTGSKEQRDTLWDSLLEVPNKHA
ncbi:hypothetical protein [Tabrizicola sp.]|uniref:hypothetical protein n=1 Tax=Tabrizicola sp. TaxID=2005166 RepID=UPI003F2CF942